MKTMTAHIRLLVLLFLVGVSMTASAQKHRWFESLDIVDCHKEGMTQKVVTSVAGEKVAKYDFNLFRSVEGTATPKAFQYIEHCLAEDEKVAIDKEIRRVNGETRFALLRFRHPDTKKLYENEKYIENVCYILYQRKDSKNFTCVYIEGTATIEQLRKMFCK